jgi:putative Ca2+/H+ antiporter (TMEM165/GDT1 family)
MLTGGYPSLMIFSGRNKNDLKLFLSTMGIVLISEMGDKTQLTTLLLASENPLYICWVGLGSALALITTSFLEVIIGSHIIARYLEPATIRIISSLLFIVLGILLLAGVIGGLNHG